MLDKNKELKIAIIHDHLGFKGGGERTVLLTALELGADFITAYAHPDTFPDYQEKLGERLIVLSTGVINTRVIRFFWIRWLFWRHRRAFKKYDVILASSNIATEMAAKHFRPDAFKMTYTHSTPRRIFDQYEYSKSTYPRILRPAFAVFVRLWRRFYLRAVRIYDFNIANSNCVRQRIIDHTGSDANAVLYPPIMVDKFKWLGQQDYFFSWARLDELKRVELIVKAFQKMPDKKLIVASGGPRLETVKRLAEGCPNIEILGWIPDERLFDLVGNCRAAVYIPINEDAGMTHLEANAAGKPVIAVREGGLIESVIDGETGILMREDPDEEDLIRAVRKMTPEWCLERKERCVEQARRYSKEVFMAKMKEIIRKNDPRRPLLGIDASRWEDPRFPGRTRRTGVEVYTWNLLKELVPLAQKRGLRVRLYTPRLIPEFSQEIQKIIPGRKGWTRKGLTRELRYSAPDYFFTPSFYIPKTAPRNSFATVHDVIYRSEPEKYSLKERLMLEYSTYLNIRRAAKIITVSEFSRSEINKYLKFPAEKIVVAPLGHDPWPDIERGLEREKKIFYVGRVEKKKSVDVLVRAFKIFDGQEPGWKLVLLGKLGFKGEEIVKLIRENGLKGRIELAGPLGDDFKKMSLTTAGIFVHPSASEGSCLPLFEAWDSMTPAVVADIPVLKEIGRKGALFFEPGRAEDLAEKLLKLARDKDLRASLTAEGRKNLEAIPWSRTAEITLDAILNK